MVFQDIYGGPATEKPQNLVNTPLRRQSGQVSAERRLGLNYSRSCVPRVFLEPSALTFSIEAVTI